MLPGFRLVCATVVLAISLMVFGLGAAALLRASHDQFASLPPPQAPREPLLSREGELRQATLALLRVEMMAEQTEAPKPSVDAAENVSVLPVAAVEPSDATAPEPVVVARADETTAHIEPAVSDPPLIAPRGVIGEAGDAPEQAARTDAKVVAMADDKPPPAAASPDGTACVPVASPELSQPLAMLVDQVPPRGDATKPAIAGKSAVDRAQHARAARHRLARLRRHRLLLQAQARAAALAVQQQQAQQSNPFFGGFAVTRTRQSTPRT